MTTITTGQIKHEIEIRMKGGLAQAAERGMEPPANFPALMQEGARQLAQTLGYTGDVEELAQWAGNLAHSLLQPAAAPATAPEAPAAIEVPAAVTLRHTPQDVLQDAVDFTLVARVTTQHAASSYGQPVVLRQDGSLVDYGAIDAVHLLGSPVAVAEAVARALAPFDIRVTTQPDPSVPGRRFPTIAAALLWLQQAGIPTRDGWDGVDEESLATWLWREATDAEHPEDGLPRYYRESME